MVGRGRFGTFSWIGVVFGMATVIATASDLHAARPPLWLSAPAILATDTTGGLSQRTKIIGFAPHGSSPDPFIVSNDGCGNNPQWWLTVCDGFVRIPDTDGDPAVAFASTFTGTEGQFWICGHSASTGHIYCQRGALHAADCSLPERQPPFYHSIDGLIGQVGSATFGPSPALVRILNVQNTWFVWLFAQGSNGQVWSSGRPDGGIWGSWTQLPTFPGGFSSPPAATAYASGRIIVCARQLSNSKYACTHQDFGPFGSLVWSSWTEVPSSYQYGTKPALATSNSSIYLFGIDIGGSQNEIVNFLPLGGGTWSANAVVGTGYGFSAGPAAIGISYGAGIGPNVLTVGRGGDTAYYWDSGSSSGWNVNWTQIQVAN